MLPATAVQLIDISRKVEKELVILGSLILILEIEGEIKYGSLCCLLPWRSINQILRGLACNKHPS